MGDERTLYKLKSADVKEMGILDACKKKGLDIFETDLGDVLVQFIFFWKDLLD